jgi:hypothetical protein
MFRSRTNTQSQRSQIQNDEWGFRVQIRNHDSHDLKDNTREHERRTRA